MNVEIETEAAQFLFWEYLFWIFGSVSLQCMAANRALLGTREKISISLDFYNFWVAEINL